MDVQLNIRRNALELQDYLSDLTSWEKNVKKRDEALAAKQFETRDLPPVRGRVDACIATAPVEMQRMAPRTASASKSAADHTYDRAAAKWDKFDVDKALLEAEKTEDADKTNTKLPPLSSPAEPPLPPDLGRKENRIIPTTSTGWKNEGNELFKQGKFALAIDSYTKSIDMERTCLAYANRAMAHIKLEQWKEAEEDCSAALELDASYIKAYQRRATARMALGGDGLEDYEAALRWSHDAALRDERDAAWQRRMVASGVERVALPEVRGGVVVVMEQQKKMIQVVQEKQEDEEDGMLPIPVQATTRPQPTPTTSTTTTTTPAILQRPPKTSTEFETAWKSVKHDVHAQLAYLNLMPPSTLPLVFKTSMTPLVLGEILTALVMHGEPTSWVMDMVMNLSKVPRFEMTLLGVPRGKREGWRVGVERLGEGRDVLSKVLGM